METHSDVENQMEKIRYVFQHALSISAEQDELSIRAHLENVAPEFRAVAYEGIAMGLASKDLSGGTLKLWRSFMRSSDSSYSPHVHVGLGWAVAKQNLSSLFFLDTLDPLMLYRVLDGCGYYHGMFRQIQTITKKERPVSLQEKDFEAFDQGVGRSIWYICKGDCTKADELIQGFSTERRPDLWRGIGIACSFVGKCSTDVLEKLSVLAADCRPQLALGAAIVARARILTNSLTEDSELTCRVWCKLSASQVMALTVAAEPSYALNPYDAYKCWIMEMRSKLSGVLNYQ